MEEATCDRMPEVQMALNLLSCDVQNIAEALEQLEERLKSALRQHEPSAKNPGLCPETQSKVPLVSLIDAISQQAARVHRRVLSIRDRLEI